MGLSQNRCPSPVSNRRDAIHGVRGRRARSQRHECRPYDDETML